MTNISGSKQRHVCAVVSAIVTRTLATRDAAAGDRLIARITQFEASVAPHIIAAIEKCSASPFDVLKLMNDNVMTDAIGTYDPSEFKTRPGLWVSGAFASRVGSKAKPVENLSAITLSSFGLAKDANDKDIKSDSNMPANHVFESESEFVACLDQMIQKLPECKDGDLVNNGEWNIFYVADNVVLVRRSLTRRRQWRVSAWERIDDLCWGANDYVFARTSR